MEVSRTVLLCVCIGLSASLPTSPSEEAAAPAALDFFASNTSHIVAVNLLKSNIDIDGNQIHSPLGVTTILALLAEGAAGDTYEEFTKVLGYPKKREELRVAMKRLLGKYKSNTGPSYDTRFFIYRGVNVRTDYKQLLKDYYFVTVSDIDRSECEQKLANAEVTTHENSKDVIGFETLKLIKETPVENVVEEQTITAKLPDEEDWNISTKPSKFDEFVDDKQYVEKPVILEEIKQENDKQMQQQQEQQQNLKVEEQKETEVISDVSTIESFEKKVAAVELKEQEEQEHELDIVAATEKASIVAEKTKREDDLNSQENETVQLDEKLSKNFNDAGEFIAPLPEVSSSSSNEPEKVTLPLQKLENVIDTIAKDSASEIMEAVETHLSSVRRSQGARNQLFKGEVTSTLSANSIKGRENNGENKMLLMNILYYRSNWATPFLEKRTSKNFFHMTHEDTVETSTMAARGTFHYAEAPHLNAKIICLPYENKKYAMVLFVPNEIEGLRALIEKLQPADLDYIKKHGKEEELQLVLPKFTIEGTSHSETMLKELGMKSLFSREKSNLSLMSEDNDIHVGEIAQFVSLRVDEAGSGENALTAISTQGRNAEAAVTEIEINRPFLYFVMDCEESFVLVSGKVYTPEFKDDIPASISVEVEFEDA